MYADRKKVRTVVTKLRFSEKEERRLAACVKTDGGQKATLMHSWVMAKVTEIETSKD